MTEVASRFASVNGLRAHYLTAGDGPPVVLLHGGAWGECARTAWPATIAALATRYRVLAPDWLGFGEADMVVDFADRAGRMLDHLAGLLDHLGVGPADMIGLSMGGAHLLRDQTSDAPRLDVRRLVLVSAGRPPVSGPARQALARFDGTLESMQAQVRLAFAGPSWADDEEFPGLGRWSNQAWWKLTPPVARAGGKASNVGNTGAASHVDPAIAAKEFPGFASVSMPGVLRIAYPKFIHYEFYVPVDAGHHRYVGVMVSFRQGLSALAFYAKYLTWIRWLFHGQFSGQDARMVEATDAPPERLYRPDLSLTAWRSLADREYAAKLAAAGRPARAGPGQQG